MKVAVYTCVTGGYDTLKQPTVIDNNIDYYCLSNNQMSAGVYKVLPYRSNIGCQVRQAREQKIMGIFKKEFEKYDAIIWHDGNIRIIGDINELIKNHFYNCDMLTMKHPERDCVYDEILACKKLNKDEFGILDKQNDHYKSIVIPRNIGLYQTGVMVRLKNKNKIYEKWLDYVINYSRRDQISLPVANINRELNIKAIDHNIIWNYFEKCKHNKNNYGGKYDK